MLPKFGGWWRVLLLLLFCVPVRSAQAQDAAYAHASLPGLNAFYVNSLLPDTTAETWLEHHIAISSRHYIGVEIGGNFSWMFGGKNFFFPFQSAANPNGTLPFRSLGNGVGMEIGGVVDYSLSDKIGLQGKLQYYDAMTHASYQSPSLLTNASGQNQPATATASYTSVQNIISAIGLMRYQIEPQKYYALGGFGIGVPITDSFLVSQTIAPITKGAAPTVTQNVTNPADNFFNIIRVEADLGAGTFFPITEDMVIAPEIMLHVPLTSPVSNAFQNFYRGVGAASPKLWYITASISVKFPNGGFSLYESQRERELEYQHELEQAAMRHPLPAKKHFEYTPKSIVVKSPEFPKDSVPDYEVDEMGRLIRWEDVGRTLDHKLRLTVFFDFGKSLIPDFCHSDLDHLVRVMRKHRDLIIEVSAYTDSRGSRRRNLELSQERAEAVKQYLVQQGVEATRVPAKGYGPDEPVASNDTPAGRASNRRVEFVVTHAQASEDSTPEHAEKLDRTATGE